MFHGFELKPNALVVVEDERSLYHLSQLCLHEPKHDGSSAVELITKEGTFTIANLLKGSIENVAIDLFIPADGSVKMLVKGKNTVHVTGFFEFRPDEDEDDAMLYEGQGESDEEAEEDDDNNDDESEIDSEELERFRAQLASNPKIAEQLMKLSEECDSDDDEDDQPIDEETEESEPMEVVEKPNKKRQVVAPAPDSKKAKQSEHKAEVKETKQEHVKNDPKKAEVKTDNSEASKFVAKITAFLQKKGKTKIGLLGGQVKKPATISLKLKQFLLSRDEFVVEGDFVSLK